MMPQSSAGHTASPPSQQADFVIGGTALSAQEREQLVRFCTRLTGSAHDAEDLVQETLLEAWRHAARLRDADRRTQWLFGIARNVFLRWARRQERDARFTSVDDLDCFGEAGDDVELELERHELAELLDRAMGMLPAGTRGVLAGRYAEDLPPAAIAERLGISEGAVAVRLHRGRQSLRRVLLSELSGEAAAYGLNPDGNDGWVATRVWCPTCGNAHVSAYRSVEEGVFLVRCPECGSTASDRSAGYLRDVQGYTRAMVHSIRSARALYSAALTDGIAPCPCCGEPVRMRRGLPPAFAGSTHPDLGVHLLCDRCGALSHQPVYGLALSQPETERFWRRHRRMKTLPVQPVTAGEQPGLLITFESVTSNDRLEIVLNLADFQLIRVLGNDT
jgi:RNA polymerase sigma-70 factor (ECF subfamily)